MGHDLKLAEEKFKAIFINYYFTERAVDDWNRFPAEVVGQSTVNGFRYKLSIQKCKKK